MDDTSTVLSAPGVAAAWLHSPWGVALVGDNGNVVAVNAAIERCTCVDRSALLGMSEASFDALLGGLALDRRRVDVHTDGVRAVHYVFDATVRIDCAQRMAGIAEALREPLASIYGFAELLLTHRYDEEMRDELTATLLEQVEAVANIVNERLDIWCDTPDRLG
jgi:signal transduction histidine kinase